MVTRLTFAREADDRLPKSPNDNQRLLRILGLQPHAPCKRIGRFSLLARGHAHSQRND